MIDRGAIYLSEAAGIDLGRGYVRKTDGRVVLWYAEAFPAALRTGPRTALRSRVIWWLFTGEALRGDEADLHHRNHIRTDDRISNLEKLSHVEHSLEHNRPGRADVARVCANCGNAFTIKRWRLKNAGRGTYCSQACYHATPRSDDHRINIGAGLQRAYEEARR